MTDEERKFLGFCLILATVIGVLWLNGKLTVPKDISAFHPGISTSGTIPDDAADECLMPLLNFTDASACADKKVGNREWTSRVFLPRWVENGRKVTGTSPEGHTMCVWGSTTWTSRTEGIPCRMEDAPK